MKLYNKERFQGYLFQVEKTLNSRTLRERVLVLCTALIAIFFIWKNVIFSYLSQSTEAILANKQRLSYQINALEGQIDTLSEVIGRDSTASLEAKLKETLAKNFALHQQIKEETKDLTDSKEMQSVLKGLLKSHPRIKLVEIGSQQTQPLFETNAPVQVYKKGITLVFQGNFIDNLTFIRELEQSEPKITWDALVYDVVGYPIGKVKISLHTIGEGESWLGV